jgi:hypothetical protein
MSVEGYMRGLLNLKFTREEVVYGGMSAAFGIVAGRIIGGVLEYEPLPTFDGYLDGSITVYKRNSSGRLLEVYDRLRLESGGDDDISWSRIVTVNGVDVSRATQFTIDYPEIYFADYNNRPKHYLYFRVGGKNMLQRDAVVPVSFSMVDDNLVRTSSRLVSKQEMLSRVNPRTHNFFQLHDLGKVSVAEKAI